MARFNAQASFQAVAAGLVTSANTFSTAVTRYENTTQRTEQFISSIAKNSFSVQAGNAQADVIKLQADLASEKISGPAMREYIVQASKTDAAIQEVITYFYKWTAQILTAINKVLEFLANWLKEYAEWFDKKLTEFFISFKEFVVDQAGKFGGYFARQAAEEWFRRWFENKARDENMPDAVVDFFKTGLPAGMLDPISLPTPFNVRL